MSNGRIRLDNNTGPLLWRVLNDYIYVDVKRRAIAKQDGRPHQDIQDEIRQLKRVQGEIERTCEEKDWEYGLTAET